MFKKGDMIVCIDNNENYKSYNPNIKIKLTAGKSYTVIGSMHFSDGDAVIIKNNMNEITGYNDYRFISLKELRKQKLNKISNLS
jgi:hypothetical protein